MENQTKINTVFGIIILLIAGFTYVGLPDKEATHYCESREITMYCEKTTAYYCYPNKDTRLGSKKCDEGWKEIPIIIPQITTSKNTMVCDSEDCI